MITKTQFRKLGKTGRMLNNCYNYMWQMWRWDAVKVAEQIEQICDETKLPCENLRAVAGAIRSGNLTSAVAIHDAMNQAVLQDAWVSPK